ncbi:hypothetical protein B0T20DRAFT_346255 [Sordaria brevicollis]|uniref:Uncharacterized protein n=1 Tax=Sordaria brevicollis TaxID=83679 RepID=A0AAE0PM09_SORBR|nr:hypothetical protein B0T20DRAFT_346255 [Sordaria brevicollis]
MSDIIGNIKEALNPKEREQATVPDYDPHKRGPYPDDQASTIVNEATANSTKSQVSPPKGDAPDAKAATSTQEAHKVASEVGFNAPKGTYGPHGSRIANFLDPRVDSDRDGHQKHGLSEMGPVAAKPAKSSR